MFVSISDINEYGPSLKNYVSSSGTSKHSYHGVHSVNKIILKSLVNKPTIIVIKKLLVEQIIQENKYQYTMIMRVKNAKEISE